MTLSGKRIFITGGSRGIGLAIALRAAKDGASIAIAAKTADPHPKLPGTIFTAAKEIEDAGGKALAIQCDIRDENQISQSMEKAAAEFGGIDILINNAGITRHATLLKMSTDQWQQVIDVNLTGVFNATKIVAPYMVEKGYGKIISISSVVGLYGNFGQTNYAAAKAGVIAMTQTWAKELGRKGVTANAVAPGFIHTEILQAMPEDVLNKMKAKVPLQRLGKPEDIANVNLFLASDQSDYINGATISVDGGITL